MLVHAFPQCCHCTLPAAPTGVESVCSPGFNLYPHPTPPPVVVDGSIIGKLQAELTALKMSYGRFTRKYDGLRLSLGGKQLQVRQLEQQLGTEEAHQHAQTGSQQGGGQGGAERACGGRAAVHGGGLGVKRYHAESRAREFQSPMRGTS